MTSLILIFVVAFAPGLFWLWLIYTRDKCQPEPIALVMRAFLLGLLVAIPVAIISHFSFPGSNLNSPLSLRAAAYVSFVVAGCTEETGKFLVMKGSVYRSSHFDESVDGIIYSSAIALGFASIENVGYVLQYGIDVMLVRGPISALAHAVFSSFWGYPLALKKVGKLKAWTGVWIGLFVATVTHGLFNFTLFTGQTILFLCLFIAGVIVFLLMLRHARRISPFCKFYPIEDHEIATHMGEDCTQNTDGKRKCRWPMKVAIVLFVLAELIIGFGVWGLTQAMQDHDQVVLVSHILTESEYTRILMWYAFDIVAGLFVCGVGAWRLLVRR